MYDTHFRAINPMLSKEDICIHLHIDLEVQNTMTMYSVNKLDMIGITDEPAEDYDLMNVIVIRRGGQTDIPIFDCDKAKISKYVDIEKNETGEKI